MAVTIGLDIAKTFLPHTSESGAGGIGDAAFGDPRPAVVVQEGTEAEIEAAVDCRP